MKTFIQVGLFLLFGVVSFGVYKYWIQPTFTAARLGASIPDCIFATNVGAAGAGKVRYSPDGDRIAITSNRRRSVIDSQTGDSICDFADAGERTAGLRFSRDGKLLAYADGSTILVKDLAGKTINEIDISQDGKIDLLGEVTFLPNTNAVVASLAKGVGVYRRNGQRLTFFPTEGVVRSVAVTPGSDQIFAVQTSGIVNRWVIGDAKANLRINAHKEYVSRAKLSPDGRFLITHGRDHTDAGGDFELRVWSTDKLELVHSIPIGRHVTDFAIDAGSQCLLVTKSTGEAVVFGFDEFLVKKAWRMERGISTADISPDGTNVCFGLSKSVTTIDTNTRRNLVTGVQEWTRNRKPIRYQTIKGQSVSPGAVLVLESRLAEDPEVKDGS